MPNTTESPHASKLRELGFSTIDEDHSSATSYKKGLIEKKRYRPWFTSCKMATFAVDETGQGWFGPAGVDLSELDFENRTREAMDIFRKMINSDKNLN